MSVPVLVEAVNGQYAASLVGTPGVSVVRPTRTEAIEALKIDLAQRIQYGELIFLDLQEETGSAALAGKYADAPTFTAIDEEPYPLLDRELATTEEDAHHAARTYVRTTLGTNFDVRFVPSSKASPYWIYAVHCHFSDLDSPVLAGQLRVNAATGQVQLFTAEELWEIGARAETRAEHKRGNNPARSKDGLILPYQAKIKVNAYMGGYIAFFAGSVGQPMLIPGDPPVWRVETVLRLRQYDGGQYDGGQYDGGQYDGGQYDEVTSLGTLDVNALTGEVIPLSEPEIQHRQKRAEDAAVSAKYAAAPGI